MGLADFDFLPPVPQTFWGFLPFLYFTCKHSYDPTFGVVSDLSIFLLEGPYARSRFKAPFRQGFQYSAQIVLTTK